MENIVDVRSLFDNKSMLMGSPFGIKFLIGM
jgi:hypothetical protein